jgi:hypothetical protein
MARIVLLPLFLAAACSPAPQGKEEAASAQPAAKAEATPAAEAEAPRPVMEMSGEPSAILIPGSFHGRFDRDAAACAGPGTDLRLTVEADAMRFHESVAHVRAVSPVEDGSLDIVADWQGEGQSWQATRRLGLSKDGRTLTVSGEGTSAVRVRCG